MFDWIFSRFTKTTEPPKDKKYRITYPNRKVSFEIIVPAEPVYKKIGKQTRTRRILKDITEKWRYVMKHRHLRLEISNLSQRSRME
jgi:hypothetical protein